MGPYLRVRPVTSGGRAPLGRLRHAWTVCEKGFTERTGDPPRAVLISILVDVMTPAILHGVVSPELPHELRGHNDAVDLRVEPPWVWTAVREPLTTIRVEPDEASSGGCRCRGTSLIRKRTRKQLWWRGNLGRSCL